MSEKGPDATEAVQIAPITLEQLVVSFGIGCIVLSITLLLFGCALRLRITHVAPRCEARPRNVIYNPDPNCDAVQKRGNPFTLGWLFWSLRLSYHQMLEGVPGTGTRQDGKAGHMLNVNLDGIVLLRFHAMALRIATFAMFVYCVICMPIYRTARCFESPNFLGNSTLHNNCTNSDAYNLTRYDQFTLANVPSLHEVHAWDDNAPVVTFRLYLVVVCTYVVCWFVCWELHKEWIDLLAMRRVYYLEYDHWAGRKKELQATMLLHQDEKENDDNPHLQQREAWIPHPEQRDTPPAIELYSVLVGGLPKRPIQAVSEEDIEAAISDGSKGMDWQLSVTSAFFDYCVPNQPGFSSSVAAVTILPSASELAAAWKTWYGATKKLQRLRFIRRTLLQRRGGSDHRSDQDINDESDEEGSLDEEASEEKNDGEVYNQTSSRRARYTNAMLLGYYTDQDVEQRFLRSLQMGPEQTAVYSMELSKGSSRCCPYGCCEEQIRWSNTKKLEEMERQAVEDAYDAFIDLEYARKKAAVHETPEDSLRPPRPSAFWFDASDVVPNKQKGDTVEAKLFGKGHATLENATLEHEKEKQRRQSKYVNGHQSVGVETNSSSVSGHSAQPDAGPDNGRGAVGMRPRLETEGSSYFPSLIRMNMDMGNSGKENQNTLSLRSAESTAADHWELVNQVATESEIGACESGQVPSYHTVSDGVWEWPSLSDLWNEFWTRTFSLFLWTAQTSDLATDLMARDSTFAVVTFTSRQAAIGARKCLADGRGSGRWTTIDDLPVAPLADASAFNICDCRGCCRPVTVTLNDHQKIWRNYVALIMVAVVYVGYTYPITAAATFGSEQAKEIVPTLRFDSDQLFGFIRAQLLNLFLALCPHMFLAIANFGSNATSMVQAEFVALQYYWWFFLLFALLGSAILQMVLRTFEEGTFDIYGSLETVAATIPSQVSSNWCNWIIIKTTIFHPLSYLMQIQAFLLAALNLRCCLRLVKGGGVGAKVPYRIYVESGMVLMFVLALAPAAPILSPFAVLYFLICNPILRHALIFTYKPQFDAGGARFPFLFDMVISSMLVSQVLMSMMLVLKNAMGPAVIVLLLAIPTLIFRRTCRRRFLGAYLDAALLQTSLLDGWDTSDNASTKTLEGREEFRQFLVDAHKAAYVPVCIAGTNTDKIITAEPAVVVPATTDTDYQAFSSSEIPPEVLANVPSTHSGSLAARQERFHNMNLSGHQYGAMMRRNNYHSLHSLRSPLSARAPDEVPHDFSNGAKSISETGDNSPVKLCSLGRIREGTDGEMYIVESKETEKDK